MAGRFTKANVVFRDIIAELERSVNQFLTTLNRDVARATPRRSGRAQRGWRKVNEYKVGQTKTVIENRVPYIGLLEMGYSRQAPNGMLDVTLKKLARRTYRL